jgi:hypothetical protein
MNKWIVTSERKLCCEENLDKILLLEYEDSYEYLSAIVKVVFVQKLSRGYYGLQLISKNNWKNYTPKIGEIYMWACTGWKVTELLNNEDNKDDER